MFTEDFCQDYQLGTDWVLGWGHSIDLMLEYIEETGEDPKDLLDPIVVNIRKEPLPCILMEMVKMMKQNPLVAKADEWCKVLW